MRKAIAHLALLAVLGLALAGCTSPPRNDVGIGVWHDDQRGVTCWTFGGGVGSYTAAISCLPDRWVTP